MDKRAGQPADAVVCRPARRVLHARAAVVGARRACSQAPHTHPAAMVCVVVGLHHLRYHPVRHRALFLHQLQAPRATARAADIQPAAHQGHRTDEPLENRLLHQYLPRDTHAAHRHHRPGRDAAPRRALPCLHLQQDTVHLQEQHAVAGTGHRTARLPQAGRGQAPHQGG